VSTSGTPPPLPRPRYTGGQVAMIVIGSLLLLPGLCSILFAFTMVQDLKNSFHDLITQILMIVWGICLAISAVGVTLIVLARRGARSMR